MSTVDVQLSFSRARNIVGGATGSLPYQSANSSTVFIPIGSNATILQSNGSTATWATLGSLTAGASSQVNTIQRTTNASHFLTFVDSDNASATAETVYTTSSFVINPSTGNVGIGMTPTSKFQVYEPTAAATQMRILANGGQHAALQLAGNGTTFGTTSFDVFQDGGSDAYVANRANASLQFWTNNTTRMRIFSNGNIAINTTTDSSFRLEVNGSFAATTKSFVIPHPTKPGMKLRYGSLEGPENGVYVRGKLTNNNTIELPDYWIKLVDPESITVNLTPIGRHQNLYVETIAENKVIIGNSNLLNKDINCFYTVFAERKDVDKLQVEIY